jgi:hypothetical protein
VLEHTRTAWAHGRDAIDHRRQFLKLDAHTIGQVLGLRPRRLNAGGNGLPDIAHAVVGKGGVGTMAMRCEFRSGFKNLECAEVRQRENVRLGAGRFGHPPNMRMRHLASREGDVLKAGHADIGDEHAVAEKMAGILLAQQARTDPPVGGRVSGHVLSIVLPGL